MRPTERGSRTGKGTTAQAEDIFLSQRAWHVGIAIALTNYTHTRARGSLVAYRSLLAGTYSSGARRLLDQLLRTRVPDHRPDTGASLIVAVLLSLGIWAAIWGVTASLFSAAG